MMKKLLAAKLYLAKLLLTGLSLASTAALLPATALAHTGHLPNDTAHGFLHVEHIIAIIAIGFIAYSVNVLRKK